MRRTPSLPSADQFFRVVRETSTQQGDQAEGPVAGVSPPTEGAPEPAAVDHPPQDGAAVSGSRVRRPARPAKARTTSPARPDAAAVADQFLLPPLSDGPLEKVTFYLSQGLLKALEVMRLRMLLEHDVKIARSDVAQLVLARALADPAELQALLLDARSETPEPD